MRDLKTVFVLALSTLALSACDSDSDSSSKDKGGEKSECSYTEPRCNADGTVRLQCVNGKEEKTTCTCLNGSCQDVTSQCSYTEPKCNAMGTAQLKCENGLEITTTCTCVAGECKKDPEPVKCTYTGSKCSSGTLLTTCINGEESSKACTCVNDKCEESSVVVPVPKISGMEPSSGLPGVVVTISGSSLDKTSKVCFGSNCVKPESVKAEVVSAKAPEGTGDVMVTLEVDSKTMTAGTFSYIKGQPDPTMIDWCQLTYVEPSVTPEEPVGAYAEVYAAGKTGEASSHEGVVAQIGYISADSESAGDIQAWKWVSAERNKTFNGASKASNDEYMTSMSLALGTYRVAYRFSLDGTNWTYCDMDGSNNGFNIDQAGKFTVSAVPEPEPPKVGWCRIMNQPTTIEATTGVASEPIYAQGFVADCTHYQNHCKTLKAEIGYGKKYVTAENLDKEYIWKEAAINPSYDGSGGQLHDEFMGSVTAVQAGSYGILYRMSVDDGKSWTYCDTTDDPVFSVSDAMTLNVKDEESVDPDPDPQPKPKTVEWCRLWGPNTLEVRANHDTELVFGRAYVEGCTGTAEGCADLKGRITYISTADNKVVESVNATFNAAALDVGNNDEFMAVLSPKKAGSYAYYYEFSVDGKAWVKCGTTDDHLEGTETGKMGTMTVAEDKDVVAWCRVQHPASINVETGSTTEEIYGQVLVNGCTEGDKKCASITAEVGYGAKDADPSTYTYVAAKYNDAMTSSNNDEYYATLKPNKAGEYAVVYRFSTDNGKSWEYCDFDNDAGFKASNVSTMTVRDPKQKTISWCQFYTDKYKDNTISTEVGVETDRIYSQAYVEGCTEPSGQCAGLTAYIGYGDKTADSPKDYTWKEVEFVDDKGNNDEFAGSITVDKAGEYGLLFAYSLDGGATKTYCKNVSEEAHPEFSMDKIATLNVSQPAVEGAKFERGVDYSCGIPTTLASIETSVGVDNLMYAQIYIPGCTGQANGGPCNKIVDAHFHYIPYFRYSTNPIFPGNYWVLEPASVNTQFGGNNAQNNDEYISMVNFSTSGNYYYAFSFDLKHDPNDAGEKAQRVFCFLNWADQGEGWATVQY